MRMMGVSCMSITIGDVIHMKVYIIVGSTA